MPIINPNSQTAPFALRVLKNCYNLEKGNRRFWNAIYQSRKKSGGTGYGSILVQCIGDSITSGRVLADKGLNLAWPEKLNRAMQYLYNPPDNKIGGRVLRFDLSGSATRTGVFDSEVGAYSSAGWSWHNPWDASGGALGMNLATSGTGTEYVGIRLKGSSDPLANSQRMTGTHFQLVGYDFGNPAKVDISLVSSVGAPPMAIGAGALTTASLAFSVKPATSSWGARTPVQSINGGALPAADYYFQVRNNGANIGLSQAILYRNDLTSGIIVGNFAGNGLTTSAWAAGFTGAGGQTWDAHAQIATASADGSSNGNNFSNTKLVIIKLGVNDAANSVAKATQKTAFETLVTKSGSVASGFTSQPSVCLVTSIPTQADYDGSNYMRQYKDAMFELADTYPSYCWVFDWWGFLGYASPQDLITAGIMNADQVHLTQAGTDLLAQCMTVALANDLQEQLPGALAA